MIKKQLKNISLLILFQFCSVCILFSQNRIGLQFNSFESIPEERTGLDLTPSKAFSFSDGFSMSFDICFQLDLAFNYGHIFRIVTQDQQYIDFLLKVKNLKVTYSSGNEILDCHFDELGLDYGDYLHFEIKLDTQNERLTVSLGEKSFSTKEISFDSFEKVNIYFGKCDNCQPQVIDIPKIIIKEIQINDLKDQAIYYWPLSKHTSDGVYDELKNHFAKVENPHWILDEHVFWRKTVSFKTQNNPQIAYNQDKKQISIFDRDVSFSYDISSQSLKKEKLETGILNRIYTNQTVYNPLTHAYYFYVDPGKEVITYDPESKKWMYEEENIRDEKRNDYSHHNKLVYPADSSLYVFGGYGHHLFRNTINKYDFRTQQWKQFSYKGDSISPRYLSGLGAINDHEILIFGGYGSESGRQELSARYYYDLYSVNMNTLTAKKIWELPPMKEDFVVGNSLIVDTLHRCFYALCFPRQIYNTSIFIYKFSLDKPEYEILADSIPFNFQDSYAYADLFLSKETNELITVASSSKMTDSITTVSVYSLSYPPLAETDLYQEVGKNKTNLFLLLIAGVLILACILGYLFYVRKQKKNRSQKKNKLGFSDINNKIDKQESIQNSKILFFGYFQITNKEEDISKEFSPLLKQLFLLILLHTIKNDGKGISSFHIKETLWFDKTKESAKNNMAVFLSKLRTIFKQVGSIEIKHTDSHWAIELGEDVFWDYKEALLLMKQLQEKENRDFEDLKKLLAIVSVGGMLPNIQFDWLDSFKANFSNELIDLLIDIVKEDKNLSNNEYIEIADTIFIHDSLNEEALKLKCVALTKMGKNGLAKGVYDQFSKEYSISLGIPFNQTFEQSLSDMI